MVKINWNKIREDLDKVLKNSGMLDEFIGYGEFSDLGNDIITIFRAHFDGD